MRYTTENVIKSVSKRKDFTDLCNKTKVVWRFVLWCQIQSLGHTIPYDVYFSDGSVEKQTTSVRRKEGLLKCQVIGKNVSYF